MKQQLSDTEEEFAVLYTKYAQTVYNSVCRLTNDSTIAEDIVQDAFCTAFEQLDKLRDRENFEGWVKRIALNKAVSFLRKNRLIFLEDMMTERAANDEHGSDDEMVFQCRVEDVKEAISRLPDGYRTIISLHLIEDIPQDEIAKMLGLSHSTVRSQYHRAKKKIFMALKNKTYHGKG